ncbi:TonB system transport protein ExbD [Pseudomonas neustonica]|uniref:Biopolymer transport protein ExbD n=1 Tax=Pseudomonas neustonica TaxID=2487346 RepID=A0ABX9XH66_9PSED|nr:MULTISPECIES: TonB system transport protein ExbD [Pseudomonas]MAB23152.1 TonB system transport protein ExbD [Pseudomonadales bacterium]MBA6421207.1 TonB system transport protein ExbD [Pseudomonas sp. 5Ae-yellow]ROZ82174.1 TonB system transport protein ExbD [Pseudomonas sp. SSM44]ROZ84094.1 TonB system transport protein ExbD [Pseudomonas neustonica]|tara:strand:+ start:384 stop:818 length:435 start_codon:yes stop_codon:yes gene_type:complete
MGIQLGSGPLVKRHNYQQNAEMNITPFVDVMLVLLIIFMVAAPLATVDVPVDLPSNAATPSPPPDEPIYVSVQADGKLFVQEQPISLSALATQIIAVTKGDKATRLFLRGDQAVDYGTLMRVMNTLQKAGYTRISLVASEELEP